MSHFIFSADGHVVEPNDLFLRGLPEGLRKWALHAEMGEDFIGTKIGDRFVHRTRRSSNPDSDLGQKRQGPRDLDLRLKDLALDGVDAEICFPSLALFGYGVENPEAELGTAQIYNDWCHKMFTGRRDVFVPCGVLPVRDFDNTVAELKRAAAMGYTAAMLPTTVPAGVPAYNQEVWDPVFHLAGELGIVLIFHTGTGLESVIIERGPGGAVINYTHQMNDGARTVMQLVAGGVLDRNPRARIAVIEAGASWLAAVAERMDEVYHGHRWFVKPKLSLLPSEIVRRQVHCSFQHDRACIMSRSVTGHQALLWGADYPHMEGTFPHSREVIGGLFEGIDISEQEKADILGGTAARLFRLQRPEFTRAA